MNKVFEVGKVRWWWMYSWVFVVLFIIDSVDDLGCLFGNIVLGGVF